MNIFEIYNMGKDAYKSLKDLQHNGKEYLGEVLVQGSSGLLWEVQVRWTGNRGRYLKIKSKSNESQKMRASADNYKLGEYLRITPDEWEVFYRLANNEQEFYDRAQRILDKLVR